MYINHTDRGRVFLVAGVCFVWPLAASLIFFFKNVRAIYVDDYTHTRESVCVSYIYIHTLTHTHTKNTNNHTHTHNTGVAGAYGPVSIVKPFTLKAPGTGGGATAPQPAAEAEEVDEEEVCV